MTCLDFLRDFHRNCELTFEGAKRMECAGPSRRFGWGATARPRAIPLRREGKAVTTLRSVTALQKLARVPEPLGSRRPEPCPKEAGRKKAQNAQNASALLRLLRLFAANPASSVTRNRT
jgi:hypothetical protein